MAREYDPRRGIAYWGNFKARFPEIRKVLEEEFGLVQSHPPNTTCLVQKEEGRGLWHVHFGQSPQNKKPLDTISFEYWHKRFMTHRAATEEDFLRDPMRTAAERIYIILKNNIEKVTSPSLDTDVSAPWIREE